MRFDASEPAYDVGASAPATSAQWRFLGLRPIGELLPGVIASVLNAQSERSKSSSDAACETPAAHPRRIPAGVLTANSTGDANGLIALRTLSPMQGLSRASERVELSGAFR